jgi:Dolichyl-phosphate-mannose-protein mannosyltransferase
MLPKSIREEDKAARRLGIKQASLDSLAIVSFCVIASLLLIANPGYFNHDELQKIDYISRFGIESYLRTAMAIHNTADFSIPVRPVGFLVQGLFAIPMNSAPWLAHLLDVLLHAAVALVLYALLRVTTFPRTVSRLTAILFGCSPLAMFGAGWAGAVMDPLYILFGLCTLLLTVRFLHQRQDGFVLLLWVGLMSALAMLSKETAVVLPAAVAIVVWQYRRTMAAHIAPGRLIAPCVASLIPILAYLVLRMPAILSSIAGAGVPHYAVSPQNVGHNLITYFAYPFVPTLTEPINVVFVSPTALGIALAAHALFVLLIVRSEGMRAGLLYLVLFLLPLAPILAIHGLGGEYLYGSGIALSLGLAMLIHRAWTARNRMTLTVSLGIAAALLLHAAINQNHIYSVGRCMNRAMTSLEARYISSGKPARVQFRMDPGAPAHIVSRFITGREQIGSDAPVKMEILGENEAARGDALEVRFSQSCLVY